MKSMSMTTKLYSVVFECVDPPTPIAVRHTNSCDLALKIFEYTRHAEINEYLDTGAPGGEWTLTVYEHTPDSKCKPMVTEIDGKQAVYAVEYPGSKVVVRFSYMDIWRLP